MQVIKFYPQITQDFL